ncbi:hypothetical protein EMIHUDRAFT_226109 [Emiliania huxleyi CCMP1516]|uniref:Uncharacterized protein n=2 Tax=Emiliania huxleyi TaxID=2903 RepID=A0A0D3KLH4_EMIH1|nr:hypothetical protein EMIHUDRAFT_226109 [Emiliania huxleyi CCMP1516]EOD36609.1 hypothetical protein EMIHUDRAFT_226109 [Emiliania huxleyi CCMP1516]|eukprot:XP_005789038.1 hypothetical protein EMIHUDRAFT_226109 [Emiliania huxleyi CCMP1516]
MGDYLFTNATTGDKGRVEYTFGYKKNDDGKMRIFLHHSSMPYEPAAAAPATAEPVEEALSMWAESIAKQDALLHDARVRVSGMSK